MTTLGWLRELLGLSDVEIAELYAGKVLVRDPLLDDPASTSPREAAS